MDWESHLKSVGSQNPADFFKSFFEITKCVVDYLKELENKSLVVHNIRDGPSQFPSGISYRRIITDQLHTLFLKIFGSLYPWDYLISKSERYSSSKQEPKSGK